MKKQFLPLIFLITAAISSTAQVTSPDGTFSSEGSSDLKLNTNTETRLTILNPSGFVGIGVIPAERFHVGGNILSDGNVQASQFSSTSGTFNSAVGNLSFQTNGTSRLSVLNSNGYVGIGIIPAEMLHVNGNTLSNQYTASNGIFNSTGSLSLSTNGTSRLSVLGSNGYVGIGITNPSEMLHINGGNIILDNDASPTIYTGSGNNEFNRYLQLVNSSERSTSSGLKAGGVLISDSYNYANPGKNDLIVKGKVAIGTPLSTNPNSYTLAVNGTIGAKEMRVEKTSGTWPDYVFQNNYNLPSLTQVATYINENKHLQDVPSAEEVEKNGHSLGDMDAILLKKIEELTLYIIEQQKQIDALKKQIEKK